MSKYSFEFKKQVVNAYLNGEGGYTFDSHLIDKETYLTASVAGTIRRGQTTEEDVQLANLLLHDAKNTKTNKKPKHKQNKNN